MGHFSLTRDETGLLVIDVQDKLFSLVDRNRDVAEQIKKIIKGFQILDLPILATEQYPQGLGRTIEALREVLGDTQEYSEKTSFSCLGDQKIRQAVLSSPIRSWVIAGIEAHVCILQTVRDLIEAEKNVVVLNDAISSRSIYDYSTAIAEMRDMGARVSSVEIVLFELLRDAKEPEFKRISHIIK